MQRRRFFQILAGAALAPVAAKAARLAPVPYLWGDGIHDDTAALQALIDGDVVEFSMGIAATGGWGVSEFGKCLKVPRGIFRITSPLRMKPDEDTDLDFNSSVILMGESPAILKCELGAAKMRIANMVALGSGRDATPYVRAHMALSHADLSAFDRVTPDMGATRSFEFEDGRYLAFFNCRSA